MSHFYGEMKGTTGRKVSRTGSKNSGMWVHLGGWNTGVQVVLSHRHGEDFFEVWLTGGSNNQIQRRLLYCGTGENQEDGG